MGELRGSVILGTRIKVEGRLISEIGTLVVQSGAYFQPEAIERPAPSLHEVVAKEERASRQELVRAANRYFGGIKHRDGTASRSRPDCVRLVNGGQDSLADRSDLEDRESQWALDIAQQITEGHFAETALPTAADRPRAPAKRRSSSSWATSRVNVTFPWP